MKYQIGNSFGIARDMNDDVFCMIQ